MSFINYIKAGRFISWVSFLEVVLGAIIGLGFFYYIDLIKLLIIFVLFQGLYYGIYLLNDIIDYNSDKKIPKKRIRPIASGKIKRKNAFVVAMTFIIISLIASFYLYKILFYFELLFLFYNLMYSLILKKVSYLDSYSSAITHVLRVIMGISLFGTFNHYYFVFSYFLILTNNVFMKRIDEQTYEKKELLNHPVKKNYFSIIKIIWLVHLAIIFFIAITSSGSERIIISIMFFIEVLILILYQKNEIFRKIVNRLNNGENLL